MTPLGFVERNPTIGGLDPRLTRPDRCAIASKAEQRSKPIRDQYRVCLNAAVRSTEVASPNCCKSAGLVKGTA
jgi:hypothetical protein